MHESPLAVHEARPASRTARRLTLGAVAGPVLFTLAWFVLGFRSDGYEIEGDWIPFSPVSQPISGLGMGATGPYMNAAFIAGGALLTAGVIGIFRILPDGGHPWAHRACTAALALTGAGLVLAGMFTIEDDAPHFLGFALAAGTPVLTFPLTGLHLRRVPQWRRVGTALIGAGALTLLLMIVYFASFDVSAIAADEGVAGLTSRLLAAHVHTSLATLAYLTHHRS
ncbi:DUF998 domain-containing protein [Actinomadura welshii]